MSLSYYLSEAWYYAKKGAVFLKELPGKCIFYFWDSYNFLADAFTNWDGELDWMKGDILAIIRQGGVMAKKISGDISYLLSEVVELFRSLYRGLGWFWR